MSVTKVKRKKEEGGGEGHSRTSCFAGFSPEGCFTYGAADISYKTRNVTAVTQLLLSVNKCFGNLGHRARSTLKGFLSQAALPRSHCVEITQECPLQTMIILHFSTWPAVRLCFRVDKNSRCHSFTINTATVVWVKNMGGWLQQPLEEECLWFTAPPPSSFQRSWINESQAWTLTWLLHHKREAMLPPPTHFQSPGLMHTGLLAEVAVTLSCFYHSRKHLKCGANCTWPKCSIEIGERGFLGQPVSKCINFILLSRSTITFPSN